MNSAITGANAVPDKSDKNCNKNGVTAPVCAPDVWRSIASFSSACVVMSMREASLKDKGLLNAIDALGCGDNSNELPHINQHPDSTVDLYKENGEVCVIARDQRPRLEKSRDFGTPPGLLTFLAEYGSLRVRRSVSPNPSLPDVAQIILSKGSDVRSLIRLARNASLTSRDAQLELARHNNLAIREQLARNPILNNEAQRVLLKQRKASVNRYLAANPSVSLETQISLSNMSADIKLRLARNAGLTREVQLSLLNQRDAHINERLANNARLCPEFQARLADTKESATLIALAKNASAVSFK